MKKLIMLLVCLALLPLSGCGNSKPVVTLRLCLPCDSINYSIVSNFEEQYGIKVLYETYDNNENLYKKIKTSTDAYDVVILQDYMISRLISENMLLKLSSEKIPNRSLIDPAYQNMYFDPTNEYAVPYITGQLGILYNKDLVRQPVTSWNILWEERYNKQIFMPDSQRDVLTVGLKLLGYSANSSNPTELEAAKQKLVENSRLVKYRMPNEIADIMLMGEAALGVTYSSEAFSAMQNAKNSELDFVVPREGSAKWVAAMVVPKTSPYPNEAMTFINYLCENDVATANQAHIQRASAQKNIRNLMSPQISQSPVLYPSTEILNNCEYLRYDSYLSSIYDAVWIDIVRARQQ